MSLYIFRGAGVGGMTCLLFSSVLTTPAKGTSVFFISWGAGFGIGISSAFSFLEKTDWKNDFFRETAD